jgi:hypothetical protein
VYYPETGRIKYTAHVTHDEKSFPIRDGATTIGTTTTTIAPITIESDDGESADPVGATGGEGEDEQKEETKDEGTNRQARTGWNWTDDVTERANSLGRSRRAPAPRPAHLAMLCEAFQALHTAYREPATYEEAIESPESALWKQAMDEEIAALEETGTFELCELPEGRKAIDVKWVFKAKPDETGVIVRFKSRTVAKGYSQQPGVDFDQTTSPVAKLVSIRAVMAVAAYENWIIESMDVDTAFLQAPVKEVIFVKQPKGYEVKGPNGEELVWRLIKSLYGLKQASRNWNEEIDGWFILFGFTRSSVDPCIYIMIVAGGDILIIILYVDDLLITGNSRELVDRFKAAISERFKMKDLGAARWILGVEIRRDMEKKTIELVQTSYIDRMLERFGMQGCKPVGTPAEGILSRLENVGEPDGEYMSLVGSLLYAAMVTRPDIAFAVQALGRHLQASGPEHVTAAKRVLRYLKGTRDVGIKYRGASQPELIGFCDADWASDRDTRRSTTAYVYMMSGGAISWASKLQPTVALSSAEAEYMAVSAAVQEAIFLRGLMGDLGYVQAGATTIYEDNQGCIAMTENPVMHQRTKHIDIRYHFVRERVESGDIKLEYVPTEEQLADLLTKPLLRNRVTSLREQVHGYGKK